MTREAPKDKRGREIINEDALWWYNERHVKPVWEEELFQPHKDRALSEEWESLLDPDNVHMTLAEVKAKVARERRERALKKSPAEKREEAKKGYQKSPSSVRKPKMRRLEKIKKYYGDKPSGYPRKSKGSVK